MGLSKSLYFIGSSLGTLSLLIYLAVKPIFSLWISFFISLIAPIIIFGYLILKHKITKSDVIKVTFSGGVVRILFSWVSIKVFPPSVIRDIWDIFMPYINALYMGLSYVLIFSLFGLIFLKFNKKNKV